MVIPATLSVTVGCGFKERIYIPNPPDQNFKSTSLRVAVIELEDRNPTAKVRTFGALGFADVPGVLYATETDVGNPTQFGKCLAAELKSAQLFSQVDYFPTWEKMTTGYTEYDLVVTGVLNHDTVVGTKTSYGLGPSGVLFMFLGLPWGSDSRDVEFQIYAFHPRKPWAHAWQHKVSFKDYNLYGLYYGHFSDGRLMVNRSRIMHVSSPDDYYNSDYKYSDYCTTQFLQPELKKVREALYATVR
jgi:hypothetical protein